MKTTPALADLLRERMRERTLARLWREEAPRFPWLECADGRRLRLLYPGRPAVEGGPDFRDALLQAPDGSLLRGDVELHLRPRGWRDHGHERDPRYNSTVLHAVLWPDADTLLRGEQTPLEAGVTVPVASLFPVLQHVRRRATKQAKVLGKGAAVEPFLARKGSTAPSPKERSRLDRAGDARFSDKARMFAERIRQQGPDQALYEGIMEALGYYQNRAPFVELAAALPHRLLAIAAGPVSPEHRVAAFESLLLGAAGFASPGEDAGRWSDLATRPAVLRERWDLFRCRPGNHPRRRLRGMARLLGLAWEARLARWLVDIVRRGDGRVLQAALTVADSSARGRGGASTFIGPQRAGEIAVNIALPYCAAWGRLAAEPGLVTRSLALYRAWPALESNHMLAEGASSLGVREDVRKLSARRQQGVLHLYRRKLVGDPLCKEGSPNPSQKLLTPLGLTQLETSDLRE